MKFKYLFFISTILLFSSCASMRKGTSSLPKSAVVQTEDKKKPTPRVEPKSRPEPVIVVKDEPIIDVKEEPTIVIKEEHVVDIDVNKPDFNYYVIVGSFKSVDNAKSFQSQLIEQGFAPNVLESEIGFYRVSIAAYNEEMPTRRRISQIREEYPQYYDVWLLKKK